VRVISTYSVGGYGAKRPEKIAVLTALLAKETGRPVKAVFTRAEDFIATHRRIDAKIYARLGIKKTGTITALHTRMITNFGRDSVYGYLIPAAAAVDTCSMLYEYHNSKFEGYHVITNIEDHGAVNGFGDPEAGFCIERLIDEAAERINRDPVDFRLKNCMRYGDKGMDEHHVIYGPIEWGVVGPDIDSLQQCIRSVAERSRWKEKWKGWNTPVEAKGPRRRGIGVAIGMHHCIAHPPDSASVKMNQDGSAEVLSSNPEIGQGLKTGMAQVVAEVLGLHYRNVNVILADTSVTPYAPGVFGNRGTTAGIGAACAAAQDAKRQLLKIGAERLGVNIEELEAKQGTIRMTANPEKKVSLAELCQSGYQVTGHAVLPWPWIDERSGKKVAPVSVAATIAEVEVDSETGQIDVVSIVTAHDCGRAINPSIVENQIDMSITMGNGYARTERMLIDKKTGAIINPNLLDYKIMTILDMPKREDFQEIIVEVPMPWGPFGAKGMSETGTTTPAPAIANAIYNAIGIRIRGDHLTPESILESLGKVPMEAKCHDAL
jgi:xanthine dehydrogenase molybdenum-binding subunit